MVSPADATFFQERGFGQTMGFGRRPALILVDFINAFSNPDMPLGSNLDAEIAASDRLMQASRAAGIQIILTTVAYEDAQLKDAGIWALKQKGVATLRHGTPNVEIDPRLKMQSGDTLLGKKFASSFFGTSLASQLTAGGIDTLIIGGCTTSGCVRATAVDACQSGFRPMVVREAVGDRSRAAHEQSLFDLHSKYADVVSLDETLSYLGGLARSRVA